MPDIPYLYLCLACVFVQEEDPGGGARGWWPVYWNVPSFQCHSHGVNLSQAVASWGIRANPKDDFRGKQISILYDPGMFPALLSVPKGSPMVPRNGGVPQEGDLGQHLALLARDIDKLIPDPKYKGLAVVDFEHWRPVWRENWASLNVYREYSREIEKRNHPFWFHSFIEGQARARWEAMGRRFMEESLLLARKMRPAAYWGYYGYPFCFNFTPKNNRATCSNEVLADNDNSDWLFAMSTALYPSLYLRQKGFNSEKRSQFMTGRLREARRVAARHRLPSYPYLRFKYPDTNQFLSPTDMLNSLLLSKEMGSSGAVIWGASNDVNTEAKCIALYRYLEGVLGPAVMQVSTVRGQAKGPTTARPQRPQNPTSNNLVDFSFPP